MPETRVRIGGSSFTTFNYRGQPIAFLDQIVDTGQAPVAAYDAIHPLGFRHPVEIATARAVNEGTLTLTVRELWSGPVWQQLVGLEGTETIVDVYEALSREPSDVTCQVIIKGPNGWRGKTYHGCMIVGIDDTERIEIGTLSIAKTLTVVYTHTTTFRQAAAS